MQNGKPPLHGLDTAREFYVDGLADIRFLGANTRYVPFKDSVDAGGSPIRRCEFTVVMPTGGLFNVSRQLIAYMIEHGMRIPDHEATR